MKTTFYGLSEIASNFSELFATNEATKSNIRIEVAMKIRLSNEGEWVVREKCVECVEEIRNVWKY